MFGFRKQPLGSLVGQFFQPATPMSFMRDMPVWRVESVFPGVGGLEHARLIGRDRPTELRIVAVSVLTNPKHFRRVEERPAAP